MFIYVWECIFGQVRVRLGQYIMLLVVPLTLADSNQHNLADSMDSTGLCWT